MDQNLGAREYFTRQLMERGLSRRRSVQVINILFEEVGRALARGEEVEFAGGTLVRVDRASLDKSERYTEENWPARWEWWTVMWFPRWRTLKEILGLEGAFEEAESLYLGYMFDPEYTKDLQAYNDGLEQASSEGGAESGSGKSSTGK